MKEPVYYLVGYEANNGCSTKEQPLTDMSYFVAYPNGEGHAGNSWQFRKWLVVKLEPSDMHPSGKLENIKDGRQMLAGTLNECAQYIRKQIKKPIPINGLELVEETKNTLVGDRAILKINGPKKEGKGGNYTEVTTENEGVSTVGNYSIAISGDDGNSVGDMHSKSVSGNNGKSVTTEFGVSIAGENGFCKTGRFGKLMGGKGTQFEIDYFDFSKLRMSVKKAVVGRNGIKPNVFYTLDKQGEFIETN